MLVWAAALARAVRAAIGIVAFVVILAAFAWVAIRPWRIDLMRYCVDHGWFPAASGWMREIVEAAPQLHAGQTQVTLVHWGDDTEDAIVANMVDAFHRAHPEIRVQRVNPGNAPDVTRKVQTMIAAGQPPDVFYLMYDRVSGWASRDALEPLEPYIERDVKSGSPEALRLEDFYKNVLDCFRYDAENEITGSGVLYGLPKDFTTVGFYYNKDLFRRAGLKEPSPDGWTWDEFAHAAREIGKLPNCFGADFATWEAMLRVYCWTEGGFISRDSFKTFDFTEKPMVDALERLQGWFKEGRTLASAKTLIETSDDPFLSGRVGMAGPFGRWKVPAYRLIKDFDWDFAPFPHAAGREPVNGVFTTAWAMSSASHHKDAAWTLLRFLAGAEGQRLISEQGLAIPAMISVAESPAFKDPQKPDNDEVYLSTVQHALPIAWPPDIKYQEEFRIRMEEVFKSDTKSVPQALAEIQSKWESYRRQVVLQSKYPRMDWAFWTRAILVPLTLLLAMVFAIWWFRRPSPTALREEIAGVVMISPWLIGFCAFTAFPIVLSLLLSFTRWSGIETLDHADAVGFDNYRQLFSDARYLKSLKVTAFYALLAVPIGQLAALGAALLMNRNTPGIHFFRAAWYLPSVLAGVAISILWARVFHHETGLLNTALRPLADSLNWIGAHLLSADWGIAPPRWFERDAQSWGIPAFVIMSLWSVGGGMMIYLAGLKGIPRDLYEAAEIDGARGWRQFRNVTLPMLSPVIFFNVIIAIIASFQVFTQVYVITGGGPGDATLVYVVHLFDQGFNLHEMGYASAMAWLLLLIVLALTAIVMLGSRRFVYYEALKA